MTQSAGLLKKLIIDFVEFILSSASEDFSPSKIIALIYIQGIPADKLFDMFSELYRDELYKKLYEEKEFSIILKHILTGVFHIPDNIVSSILTKMSSEDVELLEFWIIPIWNLLEKQ
jgi:hypothetical protein